jgi:hypothetical protein
MERKKPGPVGKGPRKQLKVRLPEPLIEAFQAKARERGMTVNDFIGEFAEKVTGVPYDPQGGLRLTV